MTPTFSWIDWLIVLIPIMIVATIAWRTQRYVTGVADFLTAGRVAGRYVVSVASGEASMGLISLVALFEMYYNSGFAFSFWNGISAPIGLFLGLTGYCIYRFRESRAMTMGQFLEMRYSRPFRIFAGCLQSFSGVINYAIFPAVGARFVMYFCGLPVSMTFLGMVWPTFMLLMALFLSVALLIVLRGGQITIMVCDCVQGLLNYPLMAIVVIAILLKFSWHGDMAPALLDRPPGKSMLNPFDVQHLRTFNLFYVFVGILSSVFNRMAWSGTQGYNTAALDAHEQKMGQVLGTWRTAFSIMLYPLLAIGAYTIWNSPQFEHRVAPVRQELVWRAMEDVAPDAEYRGVMPTPEIIAERRARLETEQPGLYKRMMTIHNQMRVPITLRYMLPVGIMGVLCATAIFLMISTDTTYLHSWGSIIVQDVILPIRGRAFTPRQHLAILRAVIACVALFAFAFSSLFGQFDFILMFFAITGAIWIGGAGACIVFGLYWKRGTTAGAWTSLLCGSSIAVSGVLAQSFWASRIYPWLEHHNWVEAADRIFTRLSTPFEPYVVWRVTPTAFPVNSQEILFLGMLVSATLYVTVSLLTCKTPFNMDRLLHRGIYHREGARYIPARWTWKNFKTKLLGIDNTYTRGDRILAISVFLWSFVFRFGLVFCGIIIWNRISPWPREWWAHWFYIDYIYVMGLNAVVTIFWFGYCGTRDLRQMFRRLEARTTGASVLDDGRVEGHVSLDDLALVAQAEHGAVDAAQPTGMEDSIPPEIKP
jgi:solute:Na+ symporter, SSS family